MLLVGTALAAPTQAAPALAAAPPVFSPAWFAARTLGRAVAASVAASPAAGAVGGTGSVASVQQSMANLQRAMVAIATAGAAQAAARAAAFALSPSVPDGLVAGGLQPTPGALPGGTAWQGADLPTQVTTQQRATVTVRQTSRQAVLTWQSFNVGRNTTLAFDQSAGGGAANTWVALNRVSDPQGRPSQILGSITAPGQVYLINRNGVIFGATAQVNTGALIASAADIGTGAFLQTGIYSPDAKTPSFTGASGAITVQAGAQLTTSAPASANAGGGFVLLLGSRVDNAGAIATPQGQTGLAAGQDFVLLPGYGSSSNADPFATVQGNQVAVTAGHGSVSNTGVIQAVDGDVTLAGHSITQAGVIAASTALGQRGTVHLLTDLADTSASVTLAPGSVTAITIDASSDTALEALRTTTPTDDSTATAEVSSFAGLPDIRDLSRVEISSGGSVLFGAGALALASSGQIAVAAKGTVLLQPGANADVSGLVGVTLPQSANLFPVSIEPYNLRDSPDNRDTGLLDSRSVSVDARTLLFVPPENGDAAARDYTGGGLLEVSGELGNVGHTIAEYSTTGGSVQIQAPTLITQPTSTIDIAGGSIQYQAGPVAQTWLLGSDRRIYNLDNATDAVTYTGVFDGFTETHPHWGVSETFVNPLIAPASIQEAGYIVGHDAGSLTISAPTTLLAGAIQAGTVSGARQDTGPVAGESGLLLTQTVLPQGGTLNLAGFRFLSASGLTAAQLVFQPGTGDVLIGDAAPATDGLSVQVKLPRRQTGTTEIPAAMLDAAGLGSILVQSQKTIAVTGALSVSDGGSIDLLAPVVTLAAPLVARGGSISLGETQSGTATVAASVTHPGVTIAGSASIDTRGVWTNALQQPEAISTEAWIDGGAVTVESSGSIALAAGSTIDASAGGYVAGSGRITGGAGGNVALLADAAFNSTIDVTPGATRTGSLTLAGTLRSVGFTHGGTLTLQAPGIAIGDGLTPAYAGELLLSPALFASGFSNYTLTAATDVRVASGAQVTVVEPVYQATTLSASVPGGGDPDAAFRIVLPPLYLPNPLRAQLTQRVGASLTLDAPGESTATPGLGSIDLAGGSAITVDPGRSVILNATQSATIDGSITARGGTIEITDADIPSGGGISQALGDAAVLVGSAGRLDAAGIAVTALDGAGRPYGAVTAGGTVVLGNVGGMNADGQERATDAFVVVARGGTVDASGASATVDLDAGLPGSVTSPIRDDAAGGLIVLSSYSGIVTDGTLLAPAGGAKAAGGTLEAILESGLYNGSFNPAAFDRYLVPRRIVLTESGPAPAAAADAPANLQVGVARLSADAITAGGFGTVSLFARDAIEFQGDVTLAVAQAITLQEGALADTAMHGHVTLSAPYVLLSGATTPLAAPNNTTLYAPYTEVPGAEHSRATLTVDADLIDLQNAVTFGASGVPGVIPSNGRSLPKFDLAAFGDVDLASTGDIRFLTGSAPISYRQTNGGSGSSDRSLLVSAGDVSFHAAQVYPVTGATAEVYVGLFADTGAQGQTYIDNPSAVLSFVSAGAGNPASPASVFGTLDVTAPTIEQGGILRAPFGLISIGFPVIEKTAVVPTTVDFLPGSVTSVSAAGLSIPYGGTADGITYDEAGLPARFDFGTQGINLDHGIAITGQAVAVDSGATLDLQGGGTITGAAFLPGRGGSTDTLLSPLLSFAGHAVSAPTLGATDAVYALLPSVGGLYAPPTQPDPTGVTGSAPAIGQTVTIGAGVPGLPAGTYTLLPSYYALQPGGYRIELRSGAAAPLTGAQAQPDGSVVAAVQLGIADTAVLGAVPVSAVITPGATVRSYAQYDEEGYATFATSQASVSVFGYPRPLLPQDAGELDLVFGATGPRQVAFVNAGTETLQAAPGGLGGTLAVYPANTLDTLVIGAGHTSTPNTVTVDPAALDAVGAADMVLGGVEQVGTTGSTGTAANEPTNIAVLARSGGVAIASGASLTAPQILLASNGTISFAARSTIDTIGQSGSFEDSSSGLPFVLNGVRESVVAVSNGSLLLAPVSGGSSGNGIRVDGGATLYAGGTLAFETDKAIVLSPAATLGALGFSASATAINIGDTADVRSGLAPPGLLLTPQLLDALLAGNPGSGVPALQTLDLTAAQSVNFFGSTQLDGQGLTLFVLNTPGIYGAGAAGDVAVLNVGTLYWNGASSEVFNSSTSSPTVTVAPPPLVAAGGPGSGSGTLDIDAQQMVFGFGPHDSPQSVTAEPRAIFGFGTVNLTATQQITAANLGTLQVYQTQGTLQPNGTLSGSGGVLNIATPLLTAASNGTLDIVAGGAVNLSPGAGALPSTARPDAGGGEIGIAADSIDDATAIVLPGGRVRLTAQSDITLEPGALLDVSGASDPIFDQTIGGAGGSASLSSVGGGIAALPGSAIVFGGAPGQVGGTLSVVAGRGTVALDGTLTGGGADAADSGAFTLDAGVLPSFAELNQALSAGGVLGTRDFEIATGDLTIATGDQVRAQSIAVSLDGGSLTVDGLVDASGARVGSIALAGQTGLTLTSGAVLAAGGSQLTTDSYGQAIDAEDRATVSLTSAAGTLALAPGATIALDAADGVARGDLELNAPRGATPGTVAVAAAGPLAITGAATIALNGFASYHPSGGIIVQTNTKGGTVLDTAAIGLDQIGADSTAFETAALANPALRTATAGLSAFGSAFHLRPGVIVDSGATPGGNLSVEGDLDLSGLRYGPAADGTGAGEPGVLVLRAAGNLGVYGSISDGFKAAPATPDDAGWVIKPGAAGIATTVLTKVTLAVGTTFANVDAPLNYPVHLAGGAGINAGMAVPVTVTLAGAVRLTQGWTATAALTLPDGGTIAAGQTIAAGTRLPGGTVLAAGSTLPDGFTIRAVTWSAGVSLAVFSGPVTLDRPVVLTAGDTIPGSATVELGAHVHDVASRPANAGGAQGSVDALAAMLPAGDLSWSIGLVAGANLAAADPHAVQPDAAAVGSGNLLLDDPHYGSPAITGHLGPLGFSVIRTGTGTLTLAAAGAIDQQSPFGIYTAGTQSTDVASGDEPASISPQGFAGDPLYQAVVAAQLAQGYQPYYPTGGGNLTVSAGGDLSMHDQDAGQLFGGKGSDGWLWEQGSAAQPASWWINFGTYVDTRKAAAPAIAGFTGIGTLGGGNVLVQVGGDAGATDDAQVFQADGINLSVGATGRVTDVTRSGSVVTGGTLVQGGGGALRVQIAGALLGSDSTSSSPSSSSMLTDIRGTIAVTAGSVGVVQPVYGPGTGDPRFIADPLNAEAAFVDAGVTLAIGDGIAAIATRGDLALTDALDPGRQGNNVLPNAASTVGFSLWRPDSAIVLTSAGGNISPNNDGAVNLTDSVAAADLLDEYPPSLLVAAQHGDIYFDGALPQTLPIELAPSSAGQLSLLAAGSIYGTATQTAIQMSGAPDGASDLPNPFRPAAGTNLFTFQADSPTGPLQPPGATPIRVYAGSGDIVGLTVGQITNASLSGFTVNTYQGSVPTRVIAGRDIVDFGQPLATYSAGLFVNDDAADVSVLQAGRDIIYASADVAGPGLLYVQAGRDLYQANRGIITSLGQQVVDASTPPSDSSGGAAITALAGVGSAGPAWTAFADLYFDDSNQANPALLITDPANAGKVQQTYGAALLAWLQQNTGYGGGQAGALAAFLALPVERQSEFLLPVYFDELRLSGRQFTDANSSFYKSYVRGKQAIATLFPGNDYSGGVTMFATPPSASSRQGLASAITTAFGGDITVLAPGGAVSLGTNQPGTFPSTYGLITFGQGDVDVYSLGSVLLGTSRIFTTFGGGITIWSAQGDINAGEGTKSAVVAQPFSLNYDLLGDITLSPQAPSTGAGIATLNEIPGTVPGDVDLVAPQGTIDAGEAGIRSSGNANLAALAIANGANLQVQGKTSGTAAVVAPNIGALTAAASVGGAAQNAGQQTAAGQQQPGSASIITVEVLGFGG